MEAKHTMKDNQGKPHADATECLKMKEENDELKKLNRDKEDAASELKSEMEKSEKHKEPHVESATKKHEDMRIGSEKKMD